MSLIVVKRQISVLFLSSVFMSIANPWLLLLLVVVVLEVLVLLLSLLLLIFLSSYYYDNYHYFEYHKITLTGMSILNLLQNCI